MEAAALAVTSAIVGETINQAVSATFSKGVELFQVFESKKKVLILLSNGTEDDWTNAEVYLADGTSNDVPPRTIKKKEGGTYMIRRSRLPMIAGGGAINGILTYKINEAGDILVIYFKIPIDNIWRGSNCWNVKIYSNEEIQSYGTGQQKLAKIYKLMSQKPNKADNSYNYEQLVNNYEAKCIMTATAKARYRIDVKKISTDDKAPSEDKSLDAKSDEDITTSNEDDKPSFVSCKDSLEDQPTT